MQSVRYDVDMMDQEIDLLYKQLELQSGEVTRMKLSNDLLLADIKDQSGLIQRQADYIKELIERSEMVLNRANDLEKKLKKANASNKRLTLVNQDLADQLADFEKMNLQQEQQINDMTELVQSMVN